MNIIIRAYQNTDLPAMNQIWNEVVEDGVAFPQEDFLNAETGKAFFAEQTYTAVAEDTDTFTKNHIPSVVIYHCPAIFPFYLLHKIH